MNDDANGAIDRRTLLATAASITLPVKQNRKRQAVSTFVGAQSPANFTDGVI